MIVIMARKKKHPCLNRLTVTVKSNYNYKGIPQSTAATLATPPANCQCGGGLHIPSQIEPLILLRLFKTSAGLAFG